jgi:glutaredoxin
MARFKKCPFCGAADEKLHIHFANKHANLMLEGSAWEVANKYRLARPTVSAARTILTKHKKCPRCNKEMGTISEHIAEYHMVELAVARKLKLYWAQISRAMFNGQISKETLKNSFCAAGGTTLDVDYEEDTILITIDGKQIRPMGRMEFGVGLLMSGLVQIVEKEQPLEEEDRDYIPILRSRLDIPIEVCNFLEKASAIANGIDKES